MRGLERERERERVDVEVDEDRINFPWKQIVVSFRVFIA